MPIRAALFSQGFCKYTEALNPLTKAVYPFSTEARMKNTLSTAFTRGNLLLIIIILLHVSIGLYRIAYSDGAFTDDEYLHYMLTLTIKDTPSHLVDAFNKPLFAILYYPFIDISLSSARLFTLFITVLSALLLFRFLHEEKSNPNLGVLLLLCLPTYFTYSIACLTEPLAGLLLILSLYLNAKGRYILSSIVVSLLPLIRLELIFLMPCFVVYWLLKKEYRALIFVITGAFLWWILSLSLTHSPSWLFNSFIQYTSGTRPEGENLLFWFKKLILILGPAGLVLLVFGFFTSFKDRPLYISLFLIFLLINVILSLIGHSVGHDRFFVSISPLVVFIAIKGLKGIEHKRISRITFIIISISLTLVYAYFGTIGRYMPEFSIYRYLPLFIILLSFIRFGTNLSYLNPWLLIGLMLPLVLQALYRTITGGDIIPFPIVRLVRFILIILVLSYLIKVFFKRRVENLSKGYLIKALAVLLLVSFILPSFSITNPRGLINGKNTEERLCEDAISFLKSHYLLDKDIWSTSAILWYKLKSEQQGIRFHYEYDFKRLKVDDLLLLDNRTLSKRHIEGILNNTKEYNLLLHLSKTSPHLEYRDFHIYILRRIR